MQPRFAMVLLAGASTLVPAAAFAQTPAPEPAAPVQTAESAASDIVVTGSRVIRNGNNSPTPVTVIAADELKTTHPSTVFEGLLDLPAFAGSRGAASTPARSSAGGNNNQINALNLRGLGPVRTLVLFDGHRVPPTQQDGLVDANVIPQMLLQRVDVVTGGASAVYGSDAIGGVVNFITDRKFTGLKVEAQGGVSERNDSPTYNVGVAWGTNLFGGRGHFEASAQRIYDRGVTRDQRREYDARWSIQGDGCLTVTPTCVPFFLVRDATVAGATWGGKIIAPTTNNTLLNYNFISNGFARPFVNGTAIPGNSAIQIGGEGSYDTGSSIKGQQQIDQLFGRFDFDVTDGLHFFAVGAYTNNHSSNVFGNANFSATLRSDNPYLAPFLATLTPAQRAGFPATFTLAKKYLFPSASNDFITKSRYFNGGLEGKFGDFSWEANYTHSYVTLDARGNFTFNQGRLFSALDAVDQGRYSVLSPTGAPLGTANGNIVCWISTQPALASRYPGCVPINPFGPTSDTPESIEYARQVGRTFSKMPNDAIAGSITGSPFSTWAGPLTVALSGEWHRQGFSLTSTNLPINLARLDCTSFRLNCTSPSPGVSAGTAEFAGATAPRPPVHMSVAEAAAEMDIPLLKDAPFAQSLNLNLAGRYARYTVVGNPDPALPNDTNHFSAKTWKVGIDWHVNDAIALRGTRSRDIRAPNLFELFRPTGTTLSTNTIDRLTGQNRAAGNALIALVSRGNPDLTPEIASTTTLGLVLKPTSRISLAVDYFDIKIKEFITSINGADVLIQNNCYAGNAFYCQFQSRPGPITNTSAANTATTFFTVPLNFAKMTTRGVDVEANYRMSIAGRPLSLRALAVYQPYVRLFQEGTRTQNFAGAYGTPEASGAAGPKLRITAFVHLELTDRLTFDWLTRWRNKMHLSPDPAAVVDPNTNVPAAAFSNLNVSYKLRDAPFGANATVFLNIQNVFDKSPPIAASYGTSAQPGLFGGFVPGDDPIGRFYTVGIRTKF